MLRSNDLLGQAIKQSSLTTSIKLGSQNVSFGARYNSRGAEGSERTLTATYHFKDINKIKTKVGSIADAVKGNDDEDERGKRNVSS